MKPILLDTFCGGGGCTKGYQRAGFYVVGVDNKPQPHYCGDEFILADALEYLATADLARYVAIHASPPCQRYSVQTAKKYRGGHPNLIADTRDSLLRIGKPFVLENVENARSLLINPVMLCGSMFGLGVWRHRYFEIQPHIPLLTPTCDHSNIPVLVTGSPRRNGVRTEPSTQERRDAMDIQWMTRTELDEAIPPAYTEYIGKQLLAAMGLV